MQDACDMTVNNLTATQNYTRKQTTAVNITPKPQHTKNKICIALSPMITDTELLNAYFIAYKFRNEIWW